MLHTVLSDPPEPAVADLVCRCGHAKEFHEHDGGPELTCFHFHEADGVDDPSILCGCHNFEERTGFYSWHCRDCGVEGASRTAYTRDMEALRHADPDGKSGTRVVTDYAGDVLYIARRK